MQGAKKKINRGSSLNFPFKKDNVHRKWGIETWRLFLLIP